MTDIKTMYDEIVDAPTSRFAGRILSPSPTLIEGITPGRLRGHTTYNTLSGRAFENGSSANYCMLAVEYDISVDNSFDDLVSLIHTGTLAQVGGEILTFSYEQFDNGTATHVPYPSYTFRIALALHSLSPIKEPPTASTIGAPTPRE